MAKFLSNVFKLSSSILIGQVLGILVTPVLSRLYSPSDFGVWQVFTSIVSIIVVYAAFSYGSAVQLATNDEDAANIVVLSILLTCITTLVTTVILILFSEDIERTIAMPGFSSYILWLALGIIVSVFASLFIAWFSRKEQFGVVAKSNVTSSVAGKAVSLGYGYYSPSPLGLIFGAILNDAVIILMLSREFFKNDLQCFRQISFEKMKNLAYRYKKFPQYRVAADLAGTASTAVPPLILALFFLPAVVGFFAMALMVIRLPSKLLGNAINQVFYQKACFEKNRTGSIKNLVENVHTRLITVGIVPFVVMMILGPELFSFALGTQWNTAGVYAQIIAPWMFFAFILVPMGAIFNVLEQQAADLRFSVMLLVTRVAAVIVGGLLADPVIAIVLLSLTGVFFWGWMNLYILKISGVSVMDAIGEILRYFVLSLIFFLPVIAAKFLSVPAIFLAGMAIVVSLLYYALIIYRDTQLRHGFIELLTKFT